MKDRISSEENKLCPYCMGEISVDSTKCKHCGENLENKERNRLKQEGKDTAKREARKQIQDKLGKKSAQKSIAKSEGIKGWWAGQGTGLKALIVLCIGVVVIGGIYLSSGVDQGTPASIINPIANQSNHSTDNNNNNPPVNKLICPLCNGEGLQPCKNCDETGKVNCSNCGGDGKLDVAMLQILLTINPDNYNKCHVCEGTGKVTCKKCQGIGKIKCSRCNGEGYIESGH